MNALWVKEWRMTIGVTCMYASYAVEKRKSEIKFRLEHDSNRFQAWISFGNCISCVKYLTSMVIHFFKIKITKCNSLNLTSLFFVELFSRKKDLLWRRASLNWQLPPTSSRSKRERKKLMMEGTLFLTKLKNNTTLALLVHGLSLWTWL